MPAHAQRHASRDRYTLPGGLELPSVTTILDATMPAEKAKALAMWRRRVGDAEADRKRDDGARRGSALHASIRRKLRGQITFGGVWLKSIDRVLSQITRPLFVGDYGTEDNPERAVPVWNELEGYAGTPDLVCEIDAGGLLGEDKARPSIAVIDWTSWDTAPAAVGAPRRRYRPEYCHDKQVQIAAYAHALPLSHGIDVDAGFAVIALPDREALVYVVDLEKSYAEFLDRLEAYRGIVAKRGRFDEAPMPELAPDEVAP